MKCRRSAHDIPCILKVLTFAGEGYVGKEREEWHSVPLDSTVMLIGVMAVRRGKDGGEEVKEKISATRAERRSYCK